MSPGKPRFRLIAARLEYRRIFPFQPTDQCQLVVADRWRSEEPAYERRGPRQNGSVLRLPLPASTSVPTGVER